MKAQKTTIIRSVMVQQLSFLTVLSALSELSNEVYFTTVYSVTSQSFEIFYLYTVTNIYVLQRGPNTCKNVKFYTTFAWIFLRFFPKQQSRVIVFTQFLWFVKNPHITPSISKKQKSKLNCNSIYMQGEKKKGCIHFGYYHTYIWRKITTKNKFTKFIFKW